MSIYTLPDAPLYRTEQKVRFKVSGKVHVGVITDIQRDLTIAYQDQPFKSNWGLKVTSSRPWKYTILVPKGGAYITYVDVDEKHIIEVVHE